MSGYLDTDKEICNKLKGLGLSEKEARVYLDLLKKEQPVGSSKIIFSTKLHGQFVYESLSSLEEKGLVKHVIVKGRKKFSANSPLRLQSIIESKKKTAEEVTHQLLALIGKEHEQDFEIYQGDHAFVAREFNALHVAKDAEEWLIIGGTGDRFFDTLGLSAFEEFESLRSEKNISIRYIGSERQKNDLLQTKMRRKGFVFRTLPKFGESLVNTVIRPGNVALTTYSTPLLSYEVKNKEVEESYRNFFESIWLLSS